MTGTLTNDELVFLQRLDSLLISEQMDYDDFLTIEEVKKLKLVLKANECKDGQSDVH
ncbi:hypothetical protein [Vibrio agarivorans]|uniref:hypothetical protein n=1 Tax=Vibrio agarivorans TaxID=153622 RepID=UPI0025B49CB0|nr:hypothetical protein [Vibrio agarivorans]MDN3661054.1 hypothetical protein [Vibrio agarivorans]